MAVLNVLVLNSGSSSQRIRLYAIDGQLSQQALAPRWEERVEWEGTAGHRSAIEQLLRRMPSDVDIVGHRVVHGGTEYDEPVIVTPAVKEAIARLAEFAPLHNRAALDGIELVEQRCGPVPQVAVFDTAFHRHLPLAAAVYPGPYEWFTQGIRRFGFHGINYEYCASRAAALLGRDPRSLRLVICHLGNGCSLAAVRAGRSVDTTMGFTPLDGLMMGTRPGSLDPGILTYLARRFRLTPDQLDEILNAKSGLLGVSGISEDMRQILAARANGHGRATLAFDMYVHRLRAGIGAMVATLDGLDALVFTAGVGEHAPDVRSAACAGLSYLGVALDEAKNAQSPPDQDVARRGSRVPILIVRAEEDWMIARACWKLARAAEATVRTGTTARERS